MSVLDWLIQACVPEGSGCALSLPCVSVLLVSGGANQPDCCCRPFLTPVL